MRHHTLVFSILAGILIIGVVFWWLISTERVSYYIPPEPPEDDPVESPPLDPELIEHQVQVGVLSAFPTSTVAIDMATTTIETGTTTVDRSAVSE